MASYENVAVHRRKKTVTGSLLTGHCLFWRDAANATIDKRLEASFADNLMGNFMNSVAHCEYGA